MKRMVSLLLTLVLALLLAGCGGNAAAAADSAAAPRDNGSGYWNTTADTDSISEDQNMAYEAEEPGASAYNDSKAQSDRPAKKVYTGVTAAALRAKDCVMDAVTTVWENAEDIYADAKEQNERWAAELAEEVVEDVLLSNPKAGRTGEIIIIKAEEAGPIEG